MKESANVIKTIKVKKEMTFRELMEYIIQNDVSGTFASCDGRQFKADKNGTFEFGTCFYGRGETYEFEEVEEEITEDTEFEHLVEVRKGDEVYHYTDGSINEIKDEDSITFYVPIDGKLQLCWERDVE